MKQKFDNNNNNNNTNNTNKSKQFIQFLLYFVVFSFIIFVGFYIYPFIQGTQQIYTILEILKYSLGIGFILGGIISVLQNYLQ